MKRYSEIDQKPILAIERFTGEVMLVKKLLYTDIGQQYVNENDLWLPADNLAFSYESGEHTTSSHHYSIDYIEFLINLAGRFEEIGVTSPDDMIRVTLTQSGADHINGEIAKFLEEFPDFRKALYNGYFVEWSTFRLRQDNLVGMFRNVDCGFTNLEKV